MKKAVFLDRDGVLNSSLIKNGIPSPPKKIEEIVIMDGALKALLILKSHEYLPIIVTNQPDVARGTMSILEVTEVNEFIGAFLGIEYIFTCFHDDDDKCGCRKPLPGMLVSAAEKLDIDLKNSFMVGDRWRDIGAGNAAGCRSYFIDHSYDERKPDSPYIKVDSLLSAAELITESCRGK